LALLEFAQPQSKPAIGFTQLLHWAGCYGTIERVEGRVDVETWELAKSLVAWN